MNQFGVRIKDLRLDKALTQQQLAMELGVLARTVSHWENGVQECDFDMLIRLAKFFDVSTDYLLGVTDG